MIMNENQRLRELIQQKEKAPEVLKIVDDSRRSGGVSADMYIVWWNTDT